MHFFEFFFQLKPEAPCQGHDGRSHLPAAEWVSGSHRFPGSKTTPELLKGQSGFLKEIVR
jgi:hypothetical protein